MENGSLGQIDIACKLDLQSLFLLSLSQGCLLFRAFELLVRIDFGHDRLVLHHEALGLRIATVPQFLVDRALHLKV